MNKPSIRTAILVALTTLLSLSACSNFSNRGTIERPFIYSANTEDLSFERIDLTDSSSVLHTVVHFRPHYWIKIAGTSNITADGQEFAITSTDGIKLDENLWMPDSGVVHFTLTFPAIPADAKSIDFSEGTEEGWRIWGIDLTGEADHNANTRLIPSEALKPMPDGPMPKPDFTFDSTTVNIHMVGFRNDMDRTLRYGVNSLHGQFGSDKPLTLDSLGNAQVKIALSAPAQFFIINSGSSAFISPGETVDIYSDVHNQGLSNMAERDNDGDTIPAKYHRTYSTGRYGNMFLNDEDKQFQQMQLYSGKLGDYHMNGDQYTRYIIDQYNTLKNLLEASDLSEMKKEYGHTKLQAQLAYAATDAQFMLARNFWNKYPDCTGFPSDSISVNLSPENVREIASLIDFNSPNLFFTDEMYGLGQDITLWENAGIDPGLLKTANTYFNAYLAADKAQLNDSLLQAMRQLNPAMADEVAAYQKSQKAMLESLDSSLITSTPNVDAKDIIGAITAPHKGKVILIDLWNTWCSPCRAAIAENEPHKKTDLSSDDIVWIYVADESSPMPAYIKMIKDIKGIHYRLTEEQMGVVRKQFKVDGIPYYILAGRDGKPAGRPDLRNHDAFRSAIINKLKQ